MAKRKKLRTFDLSKPFTPSDIKGLKEEELNLLSDAIRENIILNCAKNGGHLSASLGVVELTVAIHHFFDLPKDKLTKEDIIYYLNTHENITDEFVNEENKNIETEKNGDLSGGAIAGIVIGSIGGAGGIGVGVFFLLRFLKNRNITPETPEPITQTKVDVTRFSNSRNNVNSKSSVNNSTTIRSKGKGKGKVKKKRKSINK